MHRALYVDEIIRSIFTLASEDEQRVLSAVARTCKTWIDPALDHLWVSLPSAIPLLDLISGISLVNRVYVPTRRLLQADLIKLDYYAPKVRHINLRQPNIDIHPDIALLFHQKCSDALPCLRSANLSNGGLSPFSLCLAKSQSLSNLEVNLGFTPATRIPFPEDYVGPIIDASPNLRRLLVRGILTNPLTRRISTTRSLRSLTLRCGRSLTLDGLFEVLTLPLLQELEIPLGHFDFTAFDEHLDSFRRHHSLPRLRKLVLRSQASHAQSALDAFPLDLLSTLSLEIDGPFDTPNTWKTLFTTIRLSTSLRNLNIQHFIDLDEIDSTEHTRHHEINYHDLQILSSMHLLQQLTLDTTMPPAVNDTQLKGLLRDWPRLESLDLGPGLDCLTEDESKAFESGSCLTFQALDVITAQAPNLAKLRLPLTGPQLQAPGPSFNGNMQEALTQLTLTGASALDMETHVPYLRRTFPSLMILDGLPKHDSHPSL